MQPQPVLKPGRAITVQDFMDSQREILVLTYWSTPAILSKYTHP